MPDQLLRDPWPNSPTKISIAEETTIGKVDTFSTTAESDGETTSTLSMTSSEDGSSPPSNIRNVTAHQMKGKRVSRTSISRPEGYSPGTKRASKHLSPDGTSTRSSLSKENAPNQVLSPRLPTKRTSAKRTSGGWDALARKSTSYRNSSASSVGSRSSSKKSSKDGKSNAKDELIAKLNKQVEMLQEKQKKIDSSHQKTTQNLEAKLEDLRHADSILIGQLRTERNELREQLHQANDKIQSIGEEQEEAMQKELEAKLAVEQQLAEAHTRIQKLSEQAMDDHFGGSKIDVLRERRRAIEAQMAGGGNNAEAEQVQKSDNKPQNNKTQSQQSPVVENQSKPKDVDMEKIIKNLKDELEASTQVIVQQKEQLRLVLESQEMDEKETNSSSSNADEGGSWKARFLELQQRHLKLECDRAWSEFQLRNRITADSLKFNRRLNHWKQQVQDLEIKLGTLQIMDRDKEAQEVLVDSDNSADVGQSTEQQPQRRGWWGRRG